MRVLALIVGLFVLHSLPASADELSQNPDELLAEVNQTVDGFLARIATVDTRDPHKRDKQVTDLRQDVDSFVLKSWKKLEWLKSNDKTNPEAFARFNSKMELVKKASATCSTPALLPTSRPFLPSII